MLLCLLLHVPHLGGECLEEAFLVQALVQALGIVLVIVLEDVATEVLNLSDDIPTLVVCDVLLDVFHDPEEQLVGVLQFLYQLIHSLLLHLLVVESDAQVGSEVEFSCQVAKHTLEEGVDGLYTEVIVVVDEVAEGCSCVVNDQLL